MVASERCLTPAARMAGRWPLLPRRGPDLTRVDISCLFCTRHSAKETCLTLTSSCRCVPYIVSFILMLFFVARQIRYCTIELRTNALFAKKTVKKHKIEPRDGPIDKVKRGAALRSGLLGGFVGEPPFFLAISRVPRLISHVCWPFRFSPRQFDNLARARPRRAFRRVRRVRRVCSRGRSILGLLTKRIVCAVRTVPFCGAFTDVLTHGAVKKVRKTPLSACCFGDTLAAYRPKKVPDRREKYKNKIQAQVLPYGGATVPRWAFLPGSNPWCTLRP